MVKGERKNKRKMKMKKKKIKLKPHWCSLTAKEKIKKRMSKVPRKRSRGST